MEEDVKSIKFKINLGLLFFLLIITGVHVVPVVYSNEHSMQGDQVNGNKTTIQGDQVNGNKKIIHGDQFKGDKTIIHGDQFGGNKIVNQSYKEVSYLDGGMDNGLIALASSPENTAFNGALNSLGKLLSGDVQDKDITDALKSLWGSPIDGSPATPPQDSAQFGNQIFLPAGTEVEVLLGKSGWGLGAVTEIKVISGAHQGVIGWVSNQVIKTKRVLD